MLTEAELIQLHRRHTNMLYGYVSHRIGADRTLAEDIVQETWLRAVSAWRRNGAPENAAGWLVKVASNLLASHLRRKRPVSVDPAELEVADERVAADTQSAAVLVNWGLSRLKKRQAKLLEAFHFENKSVRNIALENGLSERAVDGRLRRARQNLREVLSPYLSSGTRLATEPERAVAPQRALEPVEGGRENVR